MQPPTLWRSFCLHLGIDERATRRIWRGLCASDDARARGCAFRFSRHDVQRYNAGESLVLLKTTMSPPALVAEVERLVESGSLTRHDATLFQEAVLSDTDRSGAWVGG